MGIASVATFLLLQLVNEDKFAAMGHVEYRTRDTCPIMIQREFFIETDLIKWLIRWSEGLVDLYRKEFEAKLLHSNSETAHKTHDLSIFEYQKSIRV
jgi:hypothetical protein